MLVHHYGMSDRKPLTGAATHFFRREEGIEEFRQIFRRNATAVVAYPDYGRFSGDRRTDFYFAGIHVLAGIMYRMGGVDNEIQEDLVEFADIADDMRQIREVRVNLCNVLVLIRGDEQRRLQCVIEVGGALFVGVWMGEFVRRPWGSRCG